MPHLVIHIGAHKTASTLIQRALADQQEKLLAQSVWYDLSGYQLGGRLMVESPMPPAERDRLREELRAIYCERKEKVIFLSSEGFFGNYHQSYHNIAAVADDLRYITQDFTVTIIAFIRRQDSFAESTYHQAVKEGNHCTFKEFQQWMNMYDCDWRERLEAYVNAFGKTQVHVYPYEEMLKDQQAPFRHIAEHLGITLPVIRLKTVNPSLSNTGLKLAWLIHCLPHRKLRFLYRMFLQHYFPKKAGDNFDLLNKKERKKLLAFYHEKNRQLFAEYMPGNSLLSYYQGQQK